MKVLLIIMAMAFNVEKEPIYFNKAVEMSSYGECYNLKSILKQTYSPNDNSIAVSFDCVMVKDE